MAARATTPKGKQKRGRPTAAEAASRTANWLPSLGLLGLLAIAALATHAGAMTAGLTWDERRWLSANPAIERVGAWYRPWIERHSAGYLPLTQSWLALEGRWLGEDTIAHRLVGQTLHLACVVLLWQVARRCRHPAGWLAALAWAVHPVAVDAATWIPGRGILLATLGMLISVWFLLRVGGPFEDDRAPTTNHRAALDLDVWPSGGWPVMGCVAGCWMAAAGALLADGSALALPLVQWGLARGFRGRFARVTLGGTWIVALVALALRLAMAPRPWQTRAVAEWLSGLGPGLVRYSVAFAWPGHDGFTLPRGPLWGGTDGSSWWVTAAMLFVMVGLGWCARTPRAIGTAWGVGSLAALWVACAVPSVGWEIAPSAAARGYAALGAVCLAVTAAWPHDARAAKGVRRLAMTAVGLLFGVGLLLAGSQRAAAWRDGDRLWQATLERDGESWLAHVNLAGRASLSGKTQIAIDHLEQAASFEPGRVEAEALLAQELAAGGQWSRAVEQLTRACERAPHNARLSLALGDVHRLMGNSEQAIAAYQQAVAAEPHWSRPLVAEAGVHAERGAASAAVVAAERAVALDPGAVGTREALARMRLAQGDLMAAEQEYRRVLRQHPHELEARLGLVDTLLRSQRTDEAEVQLREAGAGLAPEERRRVRWHVLRAESLRQQANRSAAEVELQAALRIDPAEPEVYLALGRLRQEQGADREAIGYLRQAWQRAPRRHDIRQRLADAYLEMGQTAEAELLYQHMSVQPPTAAGGFLGLGRVAAAKGDLDTARAHLERALSLDATLAVAALELGVVRERQMQPQEALEAYRQAVAAKPAWAVAQKHLGTLLANQGVPFEAIAALRKAVALNPDYGEAHRALATILALQNSPDEAVRHFREAARIEPTDALLRYNLGTLLGQLGRAEEGLAELREAVRLRPEYPEAHHNLAVLLAQTGKAHEASAAYREALRQNPEHAEAHGNYAQLLLKQGLFEEALGHLRESLRIRAEQPIIQGRLAWMLATLPLDRLRNGADAVRLAEAACQATERKDPRLLDALAAAYAESGRFDEALATAREALARLSGAADTKLAEAIAGRIKQYEAHNPYRESP